MILDPRQLFVHDLRDVLYAEGMLWSRSVGCGFEVRATFEDDSGGRVW